MPLPDDFLMMSFAIECKPCRGGSFGEAAVSCPYCLRRFVMPVADNRILEDPDSMSEKFSHFMVPHIKECHAF